MFANQLINRKRDQQIYKSPFGSYLLNSLFKKKFTEGEALLDSPEETHRKDHGKELRKGIKNNKHTVNKSQSTKKV